MGAGHDRTAAIFLKIGNPNTPYGMDAALSLGRSCRPTYRSHLFTAGPHRAENPEPERTALRRHGALHGMGVGRFSSPFRLKKNVRVGPLSALYSRWLTTRWMGEDAPNPSFVGRSDSLKISPT